VADCAEDRWREPFRNRVIAAVQMALAPAAFLLHVVHIAVGRQLQIPADDAAARERGETEKSDKTAHYFLRDRVEQYLYPRPFLIAPKSRPPFSMSFVRIEQDLRCAPGAARAGSLRIRGKTSTYNKLPEEHKPIGWMSDPQLPILGCTESLDAGDTFG
jgi:hypothetical protein